MKKRTAAMSKEARRWACERDHGICSFCGIDCGPIDWHADHRIPLCLGGTHTPENIRTLCRPCHRMFTRDLHAHRLKLALGIPAKWHVA